MDNELNNIGKIQFGPNPTDEWTLLELSTEENVLSDMYEVGAQGFRNGAQQANAIPNQQQMMQSIEANSRSPWTLMMNGIGAQPAKSLNLRERIWTILARAWQSFRVSFVRFWN